MTRAVMVGLVLFVGLIAACTQMQAESGSQHVLRIAVLPDQQVGVLRDVHAPLIAYLDEKLDVRCALTVPEGYEELVEGFAQGQFDIVWFGGRTFILARERASADPLVMRDVDRAFSSDYLVASASPAQSIADLAGVRFSYGSKLSTSGHLMPRYFLHKEKMDPDVFFGSVQYSKSHDATAYAVRDGTVDAGAANSEIVRQMYADGRLDPDQVRILERTPTYTDYVWAARADLPSDRRERIVDAFLALDPEVKHDRRVLDNLGAGGFVPAGHGDFTSVERALDLVESAGRGRGR